MKKTSMSKIVLGHLEPKKSNMEIDPRWPIMEFSIFF